MKQRSAKDTSKDQEHGDLLAQILVESYSVALRLESKVSFLKLKQPFLS